MNVAKVTESDIFAFMKFLIVGLGNIGPEYDATRHNIGFDVADTFTIKHGGSFKIDRLAQVSNVKWKGKVFVVIKPTTYMNLSGKAMKYWMEKEKIDIANTLVIVDDLALPLETLRVRASGSAAGHNGLRSIEEVLQSNAYPRLRFGIGNDFAKGRQVDFVLARWKPNELPIVKDKIMRSVDVIESFAAQGIGPTMTQFNR